MRLILAKRIILLTCLVSFTGCMGPGGWVEAAFLNPFDPLLSGYESYTNRPGISGIVINSEIHAPVSYASVRLFEKNMEKDTQIVSTVTDKQGKFFFKPFSFFLFDTKSSAKKYDLLIEAENYQPFSKDITEYVMMLHNGGPNVDIGIISIPH